MSKRAEEAALKAYPDDDIAFFREDREGRMIPVTLFGKEKNGFIYGYEQAEKDLALTWQDIAQILTIYEQCVDDGIISRYGDYHSVMGASVEVLRRFNEQKEEKK